MSALSAILRDAEGDRLLFWCPGCDCAHGPMVGEGPGPRWKWNGDVNKPTFQPSILVRYSHLSKVARHRNQAFFAEHGRYMTDAELPYDLHEVCHSYVTDGRIQFLGDCTHALTGQTVDIPPWES